MAWHSDGTWGSSWANLAPVSGAAVFNYKLATGEVLYDTKKTYGPTTVLMQSHRHGHGLHDPGTGWVRPPALHTGSCRFRTRWGPMTTVGTLQFRRPRPGRASSHIFNRAERGKGKMDELEGGRRLPAGRLEQSTKL